MPGWDAMSEENNSEMTITSDTCELPRILVVDDDEPIRTLLFAALSDKYHVETVSSAQEAADKLNSSIFHVIICDICMPEISGTEFFNECRKVIPEIPFILMTGHPKFADAINLVKEGAYYYLAKPIDFNIFFPLLEKALTETQKKLPASDPTTKSEFMGYKILKTIGTGNIGTVLLGEKEGRLFAIKILRKDTSPDNYSARMWRFAREADILRKIDHKNIVKVYDYNFDENKGRPYLIMEYLRGTPLSRHIAQSDLDFDQKLEIVKQSADALDHIHRQGIIHRDIKPGNMIISMSDELIVKLIDFGIGKTEDSSLTITGEIMGSPAYMSPESFDSVKMIDYRSDIFSLGVVCYELFTGVRPFSGDTVYQLLDAIRDRKPEAPMIVNPNLPHWLQDIMAKMLDKNPDKRFISAFEIVKAINHYTVDANSDHVSSGITTRILRSMLFINDIWK